VLVVTPFAVAFCPATYMHSAPYAVVYSIGLCVVEALNYQYIQITRGNVSTKVFKIEFNYKNNMAESTTSASTST